MLPHRILTLLLLQTAFWGLSPRATHGEDLAAIFANAEDRYVEPSANWLIDTRQALRVEVDRLNEAFEQGNGSDAAYWKKHLHWHLLEKNLVEVDAEDPRLSEKLNVREIALVRRWLFSNRPGLEGPFFAKLRPLVDAYLDVVFTHAQEDLPARFKEKIALARQQCQLLQCDPSDTHAAALGRTCGWFEQTRQLPQEVAEVRARASYANAQILITHPLIGNLLDMLAGEIDQSIHIVDTARIPPSGLLQRTRLLNLSGTAKTNGSVELVMIPNAEMAELSLVYQGEVEAICKADAGPVAINISTQGPVTARTPIYVGLEGLQSGETRVESHVRARMTGVSGRSEFLRRIAKRRANEPASKASMSSNSRAKTVSVLEEQMQENVSTVIGEIRAESKNTKNSLDGFGDVLAPVVREGAVPHLLGTKSTAKGAILEVLSGRRFQWGAPVPCPLAAEGGGVVARVHVSFFNNMAETIMAGKTFTDEYFMNYGKIIQAELPISLMVHSRSTRWAVIAAKQRPLILQIPSANRFHFTLNLQGTRLDGITRMSPVSAKVAYELTHNEFGEYRLERDGELELQSELDDQAQAFFHSRLSAFFAPILDGGGIVIPDGGTLGKVAELEIPEVQVDSNWIVLQVKGVEKMFLGAIQDAKK